VRTAVRENRAFLGRAVRYLVAEAGIRQFLDIGTGLPSAGNVHEVAQAVAPESRVVYADNDPIVLAHARALLNSTPEGRIAYIDADLRQPENILTSPAVAETLDLSPAGRAHARRDLALPDRRRRSGRRGCHIARVANHHVGDDVRVLDNLGFHDQPS
jgi:hypothetical protein